MNPNVIFFQSTAFSQIGVYVRDGNQACLMARVGDMVVELPLSETKCLSLGRALIVAAETVIHDARKTGRPRTPIRVTAI